MCSVFDMDNFQGDLTDIVRGSGGHLSPSGGPSHGSWEPQLQPQTPPPSDILSDFPSIGRNSFGDPFVNISDPLFQELNAVAASDYLAGGGGSVYGYNNIICSNSFVIPKVFEDDDMKSQCNIFQRIRISQSNIIHDASPCNSPVMATHKMAAAAVVSSSPLGMISRSPVAGNDVINVNTNSSLSNSCQLIDNNSSPQIQISSPRNLGLIKRRKNQAKKVVCIPAPAAANSRSSGEVVPSDLWAWRKYGQKPIKGSPFPRGYYRCSSSKGCSARKQVERSRTDPNMLVITYTSEHNHPWPTQRNALAGSTRSSHSSKFTPTNVNTSTSSRISSQSRKITKEEPFSDELRLFAAGVAAASSTSMVKEEIDHDQDHLHEEQHDMELDNHNHNDIIDDYQYSSYRPELLQPDFHQPEDFFADLGELEGDDDPLSLLLSQGFVSGAGDGESDLFDNIFDCSSAADHDNNYNDTTSTSFDGRDSSKSS